MKVSDSIDVIDGTMCNVYVLKTAGKVIQIDSGMKGSAKKIIDYYNNNNIKPDIVLITHYHIDHIGGLKIVKDMYNPEIYASDIEIPIIEGKQGYPKPKSFAARLLFSMVKSPAIQGIKPLQDLKIEGLKVIESPGHTPGSVSYFLESERMMFIGDAAGSVNGNMVINEKYSLDLDSAKRSLDKIRSYSPVTVLPGHGAPLKI
ncbi:MAG: MBL fold metallo-hydrolase [Thermoplasmata archaeon]